MEILLIVLAIIFCVILFDITITGKLPKLLGIDPALSDLEEEEILIETFFHYFKTDIERFKDQGGRIHWKSAILTKTIFYVKLTRSTYKFKINLTDIEGFSIGRGLTGRHITLYFNENNPPRFFKFQPRDIRQGIFYTAVLTRHCGLAATLSSK